MKMMTLTAEEARVIAELRSGRNQNIAEVHRQAAKERRQEATEEIASLGPVSELDRRAYLQRKQRVLKLLRQSK